MSKDLSTGGRTETNSELTAPSSEFHVSDVVESETAVSTELPLDDVSYEDVSGDLLSNLLVVATSKTYEVPCPALQKPDTTSVPRLRFRLLTSQELYMWRAFNEARNALIESSGPTKGYDRYGDYRIMLIIMGLQDARTKADLFSRQTWIEKSKERWPEDAEKQLFEEVAIRNGVLPRSLDAVKKPSPTTPENDSGTT